MFIKSIFVIIVPYLFSVVVAPTSPVKQSPPGTPGTLHPPPSPRTTVSPLPFGSPSESQFEDWGHELEPPTPAPTPRTSHASANVSRALVPYKPDSNAHLKRTATMSPPSPTNLSRTRSMNMDRSRVGEFDPSTFDWEQEMGRQGISPSQSHITPHSPQDFSFLHQRDPSANVLRGLNGALDDTDAAYVDRHQKRSLTRSRSMHNLGYQPTPDFGHNPKRIEDRLVLSSIIPNGAQFTPKPIHANVFEELKEKCAGTHRSVRREANYLEISESDLMKETRALRDITDDFEIFIQSDIEYSHERFQKDLDIIRKAFVTLGITVLHNPNNESLKSRVENVCNLMLKNFEYMSSRTHKTSQQKADQYFQLSRLFPGFLIPAALKTLKAKQNEKMRKMKGI